MPQAAIEQDLTAQAAEQSEPGTSPIFLEQEEVITALASPDEPADDADANDDADNTDSAQLDAPDTLPQTAGNFAAIPLIGIVLLSGAFAALRFATKAS